MRCRWIASVLLLTCASGERIERAQARPARAVRASMREALQSTEDTETPRKGKVKYVEEKLKIEREVVAPFVAKAKTIPAADTSAKQKLAFIFLTMRELQWHSLWERFFQDAPVGEYSIYIHQASATPAKSNMTLPLRRFGALQVPWVRTAWCALFGVEVATLFAALKDPTNAQFVFLSDSTVPLKNFAYVHQELMQVAPSSSKVCLAEPATFHYVKAEVLKQEASRSCVFRDFYRAYNPRTMKHHQWLTLARRHAEQVVVHAEAALDIYQASWIQAGPDLDVGEGCSDESAPLTALLASLQVEGKSSGNTWTDLTRLGIEQDCLTYVRWRNCFSGTELDLNSGAVADFSTALSPKRHVLRNIGDVRDLLFQDNFDFLKSNIKRELNGFPHYFSNITESYLWSMVKQGFMFARKFAPGIQVQMNGREHVEPVHGWLNFLGVGSSEPKSVKHEPLETLLPRMWSEINASEARQLSWRHLEVSGKPLPLEKP